MANKHSRFICQECGATTPRWSGKCPNCSAWNSLIEEPKGGTGATPVGISLSPTAITAITQSSSRIRLDTSIAEVNQVLGGGIVPGSLLLLAGEPGVGKSTLLLQIVDGIAKKHSVLYVSGEESIEQIKLRADRLKVNSDQLLILAATSIDDISATVLSLKPSLVIIDSVQTMQTGQIASVAGSISQITASTHILQQVAKQTDTAIIIVGHVTKQGSIAGPKVLEHLVDVVLHLEGERFGSFKLLRGIKNRFGATHETGIFQMSEAGMTAVKNPSATLIAERQHSDGSSILATMEGTRPLLVEVQALVNNSPFGYPKRTAAGFDINRLHLLIAVLGKRAGVNLSEKDVYINIVGGIKVNEPAADLAVALAIASVALRQPVNPDIVIFGEVGLSGEVRTVSDQDKRIREAKKLNFKRAVGPKSSEKFIDSVTSIKGALKASLLPKK